MHHAEVVPEHLLVTLVEQEGGHRSVDPAQDESRPGEGLTDARALLAVSRRRTAPMCGSRRG
jgi:hypothetical protein